MSGKVCLVLLHGSGSSGYDIAGYLNSVPVPEFKYNTFRDAASSHLIDIITPTADRRRYSAMGGERCNVWFDRTESFMRKGLSDSEDLEGAEYSINMVLDIISKVEREYEHVFVGGFSMGGGLALHTLRKDQPSKLRGIFTMGSFLVQESAVVTGPLGRASKVPLLMMHGEEDSMIRCEWGRQTAANLLLRGLDVQFRTYKRVDHEMDTSELADLLSWVRDVLHIYQQNITTEAAEAKSPERLPSSRQQGDKHHGDSKTPAEGESKDEGKGDDDEMDVAEAEVAHSAAQLAFDQQRHGQQQGSMTVRTEESAAQKAGMHIPYTVETVRASNSSGSSTGRTTAAAPSVRLRYAVPQDLVAVLTARPVLACGSMFEIQPDLPNGVQVLLQSSDPHSTAVQIGLRLQNRISSGSASLNPCPIS